VAYSIEVLDHFNSPRNVGSMDESSPDTGIHIVGAPSCGDVLQISIKVENGRIIDAKFKAFGCGSAIASSSYLTEQIIGKTLEEAMEINNKDIARALALPPIKWHCSVLAEDAVRGSINNYKSKQK